MMLIQRFRKATKELLDFLRETKIRRPDLVVPLGESLLENKGSSLGDDIWTIYEQVAIAALDLGSLELAQRYVTKLLEKFPKSHRVNRVRGMLLEARREWEKANELYSKLIEHDPSDTFAAKRRICVLKAQGRTRQAIEALNQYLEDFQADEVAWHELGNLYLSQQSYKMAAFCFEELILAAPHNYHLYCRYGEILYSMAGQNSKHNLGLAKKYFCYSLKLSDENNLRSYFGIILCIQSARSKKITLTQSSTEDEKLYEWSKKKISSIYKTQNSSLQSVVSSYLNKST